MNKNYTSRELAEEIVAQAENARTIAGPLPIEDFAPVEEVEKWLLATGNEGDAEEISEWIYKILDDRKVSAEDWVDYLIQINAIDDPWDYATALRAMAKPEIAQYLANQSVDVPDVDDLIDWAEEN